MKNIKGFEDFKSKVESDQDLRNQLQTDPLKVLKEFSVSGPVYTNDKAIYRMVIFGFAGTLLIGVLIFLYQYQRSLDVRTNYAHEILEAINKMTVVDNKDSISSVRLVELNKQKADLLGKVTNPNTLSATTPEGIIPVFTAIIGALAGLFAPSPLSRSNEPPKE